MRQVAKKGLITMVATGGVLAVTGGYAYADAGAGGVAANSPGVVSGNTVQIPVNIPVNVCGNTLNVLGLANPTWGNRCQNGTVPRPVRYGHAEGHVVHRLYTERDGRGEHGDRGDRGDRGEHGDGPSVRGLRGGRFGRLADGGYAAGSPAAAARGAAVGSGGLLSGNVIQAPINIPVNLCGNTVSLPGALNPAFGNRCANVAVRPVVPPVVVHHRVVHRCIGGCIGEHHRHYRPPQVEQYVPPAAPARQTAPALAKTGDDSLGVLLPAAAGMLLAGAVLYRRGRRVQG